MPAPLRSWSQDATGPDGRRWSVVVSVPYLDSVVDPEHAEHVVVARPARGLLRRTRYETRVAGEAAAEAVVATLLREIEAGRVPGVRAPGAS